MKFDENVLIVIKLLEIKICAVKIFSLDEHITEQLLKCLQLLLELTAVEGFNNERDTCLSIMCRASLPPNYMATVFTTTLHSNEIKRNQFLDFFEKKFLHFILFHFVQL